jgi:PncC family amidohydrolase
LDEAERAFDQIEQALAPALDGVRFEAASGDVVEPIAKLLLASGRKLAVAESCTGGLIAKRATDLPGSSDWFVGGVVAYADDVKVSALGVSLETLRREGAVSEGVVLEMAAGAARRMAARAALAVSGVAGPGGGSEEKPVGTVWYAAAVDDRATARRERFTGDREQIRERAAQAALTLLLRVLEEQEWKRGG